MTEYLCYNCMYYIGDDGNHLICNRIWECYVKPKIKCKYFKPTKTGGKNMSNISFKDCEFRYAEDNELYCKNKEGLDLKCDNCQNNIHLNCNNYNPKKDMCLKFFKDNISELKECEEKTVFNDKELSRKWSN